MAYRISVVQWEKIWMSGYDHGVSGGELTGSHTKAFTRGFDAGKRDRANAIDMAKLEARVMRTD
jgi:hypothetical protein